MEKGKKILFLRGGVPTDRDPKQIMFDSLSKCDDMWTGMFAEICKDGYGEIWYWGGKRKVHYRDNFIERWTPSLSNTKYDFKPDVIFARGGFKEYDGVMKRNPQAFKIYYGAGKRFFPQSSFKKYNLILNDTSKQIKKTRSLFPNSRTEHILKPAAENIFRPTHNDKIYDVVMVANENVKRDIKGHQFSINNVPRNMSFIKVGIALKATRIKNKHITFTKWIPRKKIPKIYSQSKVAIICCNNIDSAPRVLIEAIACNCPVLVLDSVKFWRQKYINKCTGELCSKADFADKLIYMVNNYQDYSPREYYDKSLSIKCAADHIKSFIP